MAQEAVEEWIEKHGLSGREEELEELSLQRRSLASLDDSLSRLTNLVRLDISRNNLSSLNGLQSLSSLEILSVYLNRVSDGREVERLAANKSLRELDLRLNPIVKTNWYRTFVIQKLNTSLKRLDEQDIMAYERRKANQLPQLSHADLQWKDDFEDGEEDSTEGMREEGAIRMEELEASSFKAEESQTLAEEDGDESDSESASESGSESMLVVESTQEDKAHEQSVFSPMDGTELAQALNQLMEGGFSDATRRGMNKDDNIDGGIEENDGEEEDEDSESDVDGERSNQLSVDEALLAILKFTRRMETPVGRKEWEKRMDKLNDKLVDLVSSRKRERAESAQLQHKMEALEQLTSELKCDKAGLVEKLHSMQADNQRLSKELELANQKKESTSHEEKKLIPLMLQEAHTALVESNRALLAELADTKARYKADEEQWKLNFDRLKALRSDMGSRETE